jgi:hypothetical protein
MIFDYYCRFIYLFGNIYYFFIIEHYFNYITNDQYFRYSNVIVNSNNFKNYFMLGFNYQNCINYYLLPQSMIQIKYLNSNLTIYYPFFLLSPLQNMKYFLQDKNDFIVFSLQ